MATRVARKARRRPGLELCKGCRDMVPMESMWVISDDDRKGTLRRCEQCGWAMVRRSALTPPPGQSDPQQPTMFDPTEYQTKEP